MKILKADSGVTILFQPMNTKMVDMRYIVNVGSIDEKPSQDGYCHALEHMLFAGTANRTWMEINRDWEKLGAYYNAWTYHDRTVYGVNCLKTAWMDAYEILADMMANCTFPEERWEEIEKGAVSTEILGENDDVDWLLEEGLFQHALGKTRYHPTVGNFDVIQKATMKKLKHFYDLYYTGPNTVFSISGNMTESQVLRTVNKYDRLRKVRAPKRKPLTFNFNYKSLNIKKQELEQAHMQLIAPIPVPRTIKGKVALDIACACLAQYLFEELREHRGLVYGAEADIDNGLPGHYFLSVKTATDDVRFEKTKNALQEALRNFNRQLDNERIRNILTHELYNTAGASERAENATCWMWDTWIEGIRKDPFECHREIVESLTERTVKEAAKRAFQGRMKFGKIVERA